MRSSYFVAHRVLLLMFLAVASLPLGCARLSHAQSDSGFKFLELKVLDPGGKPMSNVEVNIRIDGSEFPMPTDEEGQIAFNVPISDTTRLRLQVNHPGYVSLAANWNAGDEIPEAFTIPMEKGSTIGGLVHDEQGEPIEGVEVQIYARLDNELQGGGKLTPFARTTVTTDGEGRWKFESASSKQVDVLTDFEHPDYVHENVLGYRAGNWEQLHTLKHIVVLQRGVVIQGQVLDPEGLPAVGAKVTLSKGRYYSDQKQTTTDGDGKYRLTNVKPSTMNVTVLSADWAPETKEILAAVDMEPVDFQLKPGQPVTFRITDQNGQSIEGVKVTPDQWRGLEILPRSSVRSNSEGLWEWSRAPADAIDYRLYKQGYMSTSVANVTAREDHYDVTMPPELVFTGKVTDAETGEAIKEFQVVEGIYWRETDDDVVWQQHRKETGSGGKYRVAYNSGHAGFKIKIEADGYYSKVSRLVAIDEGTVEIDFALEPGSGPSGVVKFPDGSPVAGADVLMADSSQSRITIHNGQPQMRSQTKLAVTNSNGAFSLPIPEGKFSLVCLHEQGWACLLEAEPKRDDVELTLEAWAQLEGKMLQGEQPIVDGIASLWYPELEREMRSSLVQWTYRARSDEQGNFSIPRVRSGEATIQRNVRFGSKIGTGLGSFSTHYQGCEFVAAETTTVQIGGTGRGVTGQLQPPSDYAGDMPWEVARVHLEYWTEPRQPGQRPTPEIAAEMEKARYQRYASPVRADGSFEIHDVLPGKYWLNVVVYQPRTDRDFNWEELARLRQLVSIEDAQSELPLDLGEYTVQLNASPKQQPSRN